MTLTRLIQYDKGGWHSFGAGISILSQINRLSHERIMQRVALNDQNNDTNYPYIEFQLRGVYQKVPTKNNGCRLLPCPNSRNFTNGTVMMQAIGYPKDCTQIEKLQHAICQLMFEDSIGTDYPLNYWTEYLGDPWH